MANWYALCDVFALPSRSDSFGIVQVEAMLSGTPVVATDIPGGRVPVRKTGMGLLVRPQDERALADGLVEVLKNRSPYVKSRATILSVFDLERTLDEYEQLLQSLI
jgi:glycosyltransferase involved in cell wall biosynthesis